MSLVVANNETPHLHAQILDFIFFIYRHLLMLPVSSFSRGNLKDTQRVPSNKIFSEDKFLRIND